MVAELLPRVGRRRLLVLGLREGLRGTILGIGTGTRSRVSRMRTFFIWMDPMEAEKSFFPPRPAGFGCSLNAGADFLGGFCFSRNSLASLGKLSKTNLLTSIGLHGSLLLP